MRRLGNFFSRFSPETRRLLVSYDLYKQPFLPPKLLKLIGTSVSLGRGVIANVPPLERARPGERARPNEELTSRVRMERGAHSGCVLRGTSVRLYYHGITLFWNIDY